MNILNGEGVDAREWLVEQDELRISGQASRDLYTAAFSSRERARHAFTKSVEPKFLEEFFKSLLACVVIREVHGLKDGENVLANGQLAEYRGFLWKVSDT